MYGAVLGKHRHISLKELELTNPQNLVVKGNIAAFDSENPEAIPGLAGIIKWGKLVKVADIEAAEIIGTNDSDLGKYLKKK